MNKKLLMKNEALSEKDSMETTFGCRHSNPDICANNGINNICAFCSKDCICKKPPKSWKKTYEELKRKQNKKEV